MTTTVFELSLIVTYRKGMQKYVKSATELDLGLFSSLGKAEEAMLKNSKCYSITHDTKIENRANTNHLCYLVTEKRVDGYGERGSNTKNVRTYLRDGTFCDEDLELSQWPGPFKGRPIEKVRFGCGDVVEVLVGRSDVSLGVVVNTPLTPEQIEQLKQVITRKYGIENQFHMPIELNRDDYNVIPIRTINESKNNVFMLTGLKINSRWLFSTIESAKLENKSLETKIRKILDHAMVKSFNLRFRLTGLNNNVTIVVGQKYTTSKQQPKVIIWHVLHNIIMSVGENPVVIKGEEKKIPSETYCQIVRWIILNHKVLTKYWFDEITPPMLFEELQKV